MPALPRPRPPALWSRLAAGVAGGAVVAAVDHLALTGRLNSVVVVGGLICAGACIGSSWHWRGWPVIVVVWLVVVGVHVIKHAGGLPGTLQPDTWESIRSMAAFTLAVCGAGFCGGVLLRMAASD